MKSFISIEICVRDVRAVTDFIERYFDGVPERAESDFAIVWLGATRIIVNDIDLDTSKPPNPILKEGALGHLGSGVEIVLSVDDIDEVYKKLKAAGASSLTPLQAQPWGLRDFRFLLEDYYVRVTEPDNGVKSRW